MMSISFLNVHYLKERERERGGRGGERERGGGEGEGGEGEGEGEGGREREGEREREMCLTPESLVVSPLLFAALSRLLGDTVLATLQQ